jgi:hypothetical protein
MSLLVRHLNLISSDIISYIYHSDMMTPDGSGYLQQKFSTFCPQGCGIKEITKETLGLRKLAVDLASGPDSFLA